MLVCDTQEQLHTWYHLPTALSAAWQIRNWAHVYCEMSEPADFVRHVFLAERCDLHQLLDSLHKFFQPGLQKFRASEPPCPSKTPNKEIPLLSHILGCYNFGTISEMLAALLRAQR